MNAAHRTGRRTTITRYDDCIPAHYFNKLKEMHYTIRITHNYIETFDECDSEQRTATTSDAR